jgi:hypothetical protein
MSGASCLWCGSPFLPRKLGAHQKRFCSPQCRGAFHTAARRWAEQALVRGDISVSDLKAPVPSCTTEGSEITHRDG